MRRKLSGLAALFEEASNCMMDMPSLVLPSILAAIVLALFLTFWVAVVVCLATANSPGEKSALLSTPSSDTSEVPEIDNKDLQYRTNDKTLHQVVYTDASWLQSMLWVYFIGLIWTVEFIFGK